MRCQILASVAHSAIGAAVSVREVLTEFNPNDRHGTTSHLSRTELNSLEAYLLSL
jgi:hypothetical protein